MRKTISLDEARGPKGIRLYAIGDIHGRLDLLTQMHELIDEDIRHAAPADWRVIYLGDYVDRGPDTKGVLDTLAPLMTDSRRIMLAGNHDISFKAFLERPDLRGAFANYGGTETARSYGIEMNFHEYAEENQLLRDHARLIHAVPVQHRQFLNNLTFSIAFGDFFFCHAGIRPGILLDQQDEKDLIWMRAPFLETTILFEKVIVHGHTIFPEPVVRINRIGIDTGAIKTDRLTALVIDGTTWRFLST